VSFAKGPTEAVVAWINLGFTTLRKRLEFGKAVGVLLKGGALLQD